MGLCVGFHEITCCICAIVFQMNNANYDTKQYNGKDFYCPNGHRQRFAHKETTEQNLRETIKFLENGIKWRDRELAGLRGELDYERRSRAAFQGHLHRSKRQIASA